MLLTFLKGNINIIALKKDGYTHYPSGGNSEIIG